MKGITPCLWFDSQAEEAAAFYVSVFPNSKILRITRYGKAGFEIHGRAEGSVMTVEFELDGQTFTALNGGPLFKFSESVSFQVECESQDEIDYFWDRLSEGGDPSAQQCGWLKDKYGLSWQVVPADMGDWLGDPASARRGTRHERHARDEEARHRSAEKGVRGLRTSRCPQCRNSATGCEQRIRNARRGPKGSQESPGTE